MKKDNKLKIIKVPLKSKSKDVYPNFPPMPVLYLELLENKDKIKPELRNKDYIAPVVDDVKLQTDNVNNTESIIYNDIINDLKLSSSENKERFDYDYSNKKNKYDKYDFNKDDTDDK